MEISSKLTQGRNTLVLLIAEQRNLAFQANKVPSVNSGNANIHAFVQKHTKSFHAQKQTSKVQAELHISLMKRYWYFSEPDVQLDGKSLKVKVLNCCEVCFFSSHRVAGHHCKFSNISVSVTKNSRNDHVLLFFPKNFLSSFLATPSQNYFSFFPSKHFDASSLVISRES